jgi:hypothetical protein
MYDISNVAYCWMKWAFAFLGAFSATTESTMPERMPRSLRSRPGNVLGEHLGESTDLVENALSDQQTLSGQH